MALCMAISPQLGLVHHILLICGLRKDDFLKMISEIDVLMPEPFVLLLDNARYHSNPPALSEGHRIRFLPNYSSYLNLNAAEMAGSCVKAAAKRRLSDPNVQVEIQNRTATVAGDQGQTLSEFYILRATSSDVIVRGNARKVLEME